MKHAEMRNELISYMQGLSDLSYQQSCWVDKKCPEGTYDEFDYAVHFLFDDTSLATEPEEWIGLCLKNSDEAKAVKSVCDAIDHILNVHGCNLSDKEYIALPEWKNVLHAATDAIKTLDS